ncbi:hypothetical protein SpAn4DRAFT_0437 [Sporomusa ovata]|uniref:Uncharacterized protein n=1 Tax=Sporomusa ovata TaxID=2378 RepID=A0A0U1L384_9FIRM|nr:hypothetical protein SpAn4DRAFT_0437 [Sporomusa ovata]
MEAYPLPDIGIGVCRADIERDALANVANCGGGRDRLTLY